jgi:L-ornithine N5-monooxygenase
MVTKAERATYDVVSVGFGPAGVALAAAVADAEEDSNLHVSDLYLERATNAAWQSEMLMHGTRIQHHYLRDFATPRNPRSRFTFPNYLKEAGRLFPFGLYARDTSSVSRIEWSDYVEWTAREVGRDVRYGHEVTAIHPVEVDGQIAGLNVLARQLETGALISFRTKNIVMSVGWRPHIPSMFAGVLGPWVFHAHEFTTRIDKIKQNRRATFAVIGSGQDAAEVLWYLINTFPSAQIYSLSRNSGFRQYELGHFSNEIYFPEEIDYVYSLKRAARDAVFAEVKHTNYSSIGADLSQMLYQRIYEERVLGNHRIQFLRRVRVKKMTQGGHGPYRLDLEDVHRGDLSTITVDVVVLCTGFHEERVPAVLAPLASYIVCEEGDPLITRDYEIVTRPNVGVGIYINGAEWRFGINNATSFSTMAIKAADILQSLRGRLDQEEMGRDRRGRAGENCLGLGEPGDALVKRLRQRRGNEEGSLSERRKV